MLRSQLGATLMKRKALIIAIGLGAIFATKAVADSTTGYAYVCNGGSNNRLCLPQFPLLNLYGRNGISFQSTSTAVSTTYGIGTGTATGSGNNTVTYTQTGTGTTTDTTSASDTGTVSGQIVTATATVTTTATSTTVRTQTQTIGMQWFHTPTNTKTFTGLNTQTDSATTTITATATLTVTATDSLGSTGTVTGTVTKTSLLTGTSTVSGTFSGSATNTTTWTNSTIVTVTGTWAQTATSTGTGTRTVTVTITQTGTVSATKTNTSSITLTGTATRTAAGTTAVMTGTMTLSGYAAGTFTATSYATATSATVVSSPTILAAGSPAPGADRFLVGSQAEEPNLTYLLWAPYFNPATHGFPPTDLVASPTLGSPVQFWTHGDSTNTLSFGSSPAGNETWVQDGTIKIWLWAMSTSAASVRLRFGACSSGNFDAYTIYTDVAVSSATWALLYQELPVPGGIVIPETESLCVSIQAFTSSGTSTVTVGASYPHFTRVNAGYLPSLQQ